ncbi:MAG TPA: transposase [Phycisphaerae bacterium]|nr:transposase [Phycisphaerae bacterium]
MPRTARVVIPGVPLHVRQRGNRREDVFFRKQDRLLFLRLLARYAPANGLGINAYCLMTNHIHLVVTPGTEDSLAATLRPLNTCYSQHVNCTQGFTGHLWQSRPYSCLLDVPHFWAAVRYVERNPVRAHMIRRAQEYPWSSAAAHCGLRPDPLLSGDLEQADRVGDCPAWLADEDDERDLAALRTATRTGRPAGDETFVHRLEHLCGKLLRPRPRGRPTKGKADGALQKVKTRK